MLVWHGYPIPKRRAANRIFPAGHRESHLDEFMNRILAGGLLCAAALIPACAAASPLYACVQADNDSGGFGLGYRINKTYAIEAHHRKSREVISHSGVSSDTHMTAAGMSGLVLFPMKMDEGAAYLVFAKAGYERQRKEEIYSFPISVTYNGTVTNIENHTILGGGVQFAFSRFLGGRTGVEVIGDKRSVYWSVIFTF
ncbi:MAG: hypothetical protein OEW21_18260 [Betaproteobacteria bacterium]|nr:hypothetical protein [Betaproteobacteria bacterium]